MPPELVNKYPTSHGLIDTIHLNMAPPEAEKANDAFQPPAWMLAAAKNAEKKAGVSHEELKLQVREAKAKIDANGEKHQESMRSLQEKLREMGAGKNWSLFKKGRRLEKLGATDQAKITAFEIKPSVITTQPETRKPEPRKRKVLAQKPEERRVKKDQVRRKQIKEEADKTTTGLEDEPTGVVLAESSAAGAFRESAKTNKSGSKDTENNTFAIAPSNDSVIPTNGKEQYPIRPKLPEWYTSITLKHPKMEALSKKRTQELTMLDALKSCINQSQTAKSPAQLASVHDALRDYIHKAEIILPVTSYLVRKANMLSPTTGLPLIFAASSTFPPDLKADSYQLYTRWFKGDFDQQLLRGIETTKHDNRSSDRISPAYRKQFPMSAKYYGQGDLVLGQWWPTQLCTVRDGAHGTPQGGIFGEKDHGAYSIVLSGGHSTTDHDSGTTIEYSGTEGKNFCPTEVTLYMLHSLKIQNPIRVLRSSQLPKKNVYRPEKGIRYDGLYVVTNVVVTDQQSAMHRFTLQRCEGQEEIRYKGKGKRPSVWEVSAYEKVKAGAAW